MSGDRNRLIDITLDEASLPPAGSNAEHERRIALFDLKEANTFTVVGEDRGPYLLALALADGRLALDVSDEAGQRVRTHHMALSPLRKIIKDYAIICESYHAAIRDAPPQQIEAIDMGRRGLHNDAGGALVKALEDKFTLDLDTGRRLFTLIYAMHQRG
ncbi:MAG: UPF0262 family protein [Proteobacteria bacterium]|nr:UPF0262 family protein [Pseudomonadota bacterium]